MQKLVHLLAQTECTSTPFGFGIKLPSLLDVDLVHHTYLLCELTLLYCMGGNGEGNGVWPAIATMLAS